MQGVIGRADRYIRCDQYPIADQHLMIVNQRKIRINISVLPNGNRIAHGKCERRLDPHIAATGCKQILQNSGSFLSMRAVCEI